MSPTGVWLVYPLLGLCGCLQMLTSVGTGTQAVVVVLLGRADVVAGLVAQG